MPPVTEWDERFRQGDHASSTPDPFLADSRKYWPLLPRWNGQRAGALQEGRVLKALDVACGAGRHAVYLAQAGFDVTANDYSTEGLRAAARLAASHKVFIRTVEMDLESPLSDLGEALYDLAAVFFYLHRPLYPKLRRCLSPGGILIFKTYSVDQLRYPGRPRHRVHMLEHNELLHEFAAFRVLRYQEEWEGKGTAALIAQKPLAP